MWLLRGTLLVICLAGVLPAQRFEIAPFAGYKFGGDVPVQSDRPVVRDVEWVKFSPSLAYGVNAAYNLNENFALEFLWSRQPTKAKAWLRGGYQVLENVDVNLDQFIGAVVYNFRDSYARARPFLTFGIGALRGSGNHTAETKPTYHIGGGLKLFINDNMGFRFQARWTPTYLFSTPGGVWCDWWGYCWEIPNDHYMNQGEASVGWIFRF